jgi:group II intron reverse transcriptase/maturase
MDGKGKSDGLVVPEKPPNNAAPAAAEAGEGRSSAKGNVVQQNAPRTQRRVGAPSALDRVRQAARRDRNAKLTALLHHVTLDRLRSAYLQLKRKAAPGVDGVTWAQYGADLEANLQDLHLRLHRGAYRARPSRRAYIPKADGRQRPLGIAALEDKLVQRAVVEVMNAIYEGDFLGFSYGFRPGRSQHQALDALWVAIHRKKVNYVLDADLRDFFGSIDHGWLVKFVEHRIGDRRILRLIHKWLAAGVIEEGRWTPSTEGTPQGSTASPLLANIYLHYVLDLWVDQWRRRHARGDVIIVRYADDFLVGFQYYADAVRFLGELRERLRGFALELHPDKTRLLAFGLYAQARRQERGMKGAPETFNFLGFTHACGKTRNGKFLLVRRTMRERMRAKLSEVKAELMRRRHLRIKVQGEWLGAVVRGFFAYHAVPTNIRALQSFRAQVDRHWRRALARRSQRGRPNWERMRRLSSRWLPSPKILHPWPDNRFDVRTRGRSRVR